MKTIIKIFFITHFFILFFVNVQAQISHSISGTVGLTKFQNYNYNDFHAPYTVINPVKNRVLDGFEIGTEYIYQKSKIGIGLAVNYSYQEQRYLTNYIETYGIIAKVKATGLFNSNIIHIAPIINFKVFETKKGGHFYIKCMPQYSYLFKFNYYYFTTISNYDYTGLTKINNFENYYEDKGIINSKISTSVSSKNFIKNLFSLQMAIGYKFYLSKNIFTNIELMARYTLSNTYKQDDTKLIWSLYMPINAIITDPNNLAETSFVKSVNNVRKPTHYKWAGLNIGFGYIWEKEGKVKVYKLW
jgi:hypothetical protein